MSKMCMKIMQRDMDLISTGKQWEIRDGKRVRSPKSKHIIGGEFFMKLSADMFAKLKEIDPYTARIERIQKEREGEFYKAMSLRFRRHVLVDWRRENPTATVIDSHGHYGFIELTRLFLKQSMYDKHATWAIPADTLHAAVLPEWKLRGLVEEVQRLEHRYGASTFRFKYFGELEMDAEQIDLRLSAIQDELKELKARTGPKMVKLSDGSLWEQNAWRIAKVREMERRVLKFERFTRFDGLTQRKVMPREKNPRLLAIA